MTDKQAKYVLIAFLAFMVALTSIGLSQRYFVAQVAMAEAACATTEQE